MKKPNIISQMDMVYLSQLRREIVCTDVSYQALDSKTRSLIDVTLSIIVQCKTNIKVHIQNLIRLGVTREEFIEALKMCVFKGGATSFVSAANALRIFEEMSSRC